MIGSYRVFRFETVISPQEVKGIVEQLASGTGLVLKGAQESLHHPVDSSAILDPSYWEFSLSFDHRPRSDSDESNEGSILFSSPSAVHGYLNVMRASQRLNEHTSSRMLDGMYFRKFKAFVHKLAVRNCWLKHATRDELAYRGIKISTGAFELSGIGWKVADLLHSHSMPEEHYKIELDDRMKVIKNC